MDEYITNIKTKVFAWKIFFRRVQKCYESMIYRQFYYQEVPEMLDHRREKYINFIGDYSEN